MVASSFKKVTHTKPRYTVKSTSSSTHKSKKKAAHKTQTSALSTQFPQGPSKHVTIEDVEDEQVTSVGGMLDLDGDSIMEPSNSETKQH
jgi:hypothetical protein